jgi:eukaryotic-like serine/threonine-protein kinase
MRMCPRCAERFPGSQRYCPNEGAILVEEIDLSRIGTRVGNYQLHAIIGRGGMGTVYSGEHVYIHKKVAVKVLHARFAGYEDAVHRFLAEARAASSIQHPNIVDVTDFGPMPDGGVYFVMEYLEGTSLEDRIEKDEFLALHRALNITNQICLALAAAHEKRIVHRDLKPENIMLIRKPGRRDVIRSAPEDGAGYVTEREDEYDFVKILDFGIAKVHAPEQAVPQTLHGTIFGTPEYMSPEAARGEDVDHRADIYAVGVILFDMLTGRPPFEAESTAEVLAMQISQAPPLPRAMAPHNEITEACERLILRALAKNPAQRHQSIDEFRDEMQRCYGSVAYHRAPSSFPGIPLPGPEARQQPRLTDELDEWLHSDQSRMSLDQARKLALSAPAAESFSPPALSPDEEERLADALDAALGDDLGESDDV